MFLHQKFGYSIYKIEDIFDVMNMSDLWQTDKEAFLTYDTETNGVHLVTSTPFLFVGGFGKNIFVMDLIEDKELASFFLDLFYGIAKEAQYLFAHNAEFDLAMMMNYEKPIPKEVNIADSQTVYRLIEYADMDEKFARKSLEAIGGKYVDDSAKFAGKVIKDLISKMNAKRKKECREAYMKHFKNPLAFGRAFDEWKDQIKHIDTEPSEYVQFINENYELANYYDVYLENPALMINYAVDDIVITREFLLKAFTVLPKVDPGLKTFTDECGNIRSTTEQMRVGMKLDIEYLKESWEVLGRFQRDLYAELHQHLGKEVTIYQTKEIAKILEDNYFIRLNRTGKGNPQLDNKALSGIIERHAKDKPQLVRIALLTKKLRTVDKYLSTYIKGILNKSHEGRLHPKIDASGTVSGRYSGDMQQFPNYPLRDDIGSSREEQANSKVLFHPRKAIIADDDYILVFADYSQQELRINAYYTILMGRPDLHLCRAYIPFQCVSNITGESYDPFNKEHQARIETKEWVLEEDPTQLWVETDVHSLTTSQAFPEFINDRDHEFYDYYRSQGKTTNFLKLYMGGARALQEQIECTMDVAEALDKAFNETYTGVTYYQEETIREATLKGWVDNLFGRRYYIESSRNAYKLANYRIQGSGASMLKTVDRLVYPKLLDKKSYLCLTIHDEAVFAIHKDELDIIDGLVQNMYDAGDVVKAIPMKVGVDYTTTNWADVQEYTGHENIHV